jgi:hypothetical protein
MERDYDHLHSSQPQQRVISACFKSVKDVGNYIFCPDEKEAKPKSYLIRKIHQHNSEGAY